jgi:hypothetical protein
MELEALRPMMSRSGWFVFLVAGLFVTAVQACPNCRETLAGDASQAGLVRGLFWSILFMVSMPFLILGGLSSYFYWEICRARRASGISPVMEPVLRPDSQLAVDEEPAVPHDSPAA